MSSRKSAVSPTTAKAPLKRLRSLTKKSFGKPADMKRYARLVKLHSSDFDEAEDAKTNKNETDIL